MRVLLVAHQYWPTPGSATQVLSAMVRELTACGDVVDVFTCRPPGNISQTKFGPHGERLHYVARAEQSGLGPARALRLLEFAVNVYRAGSDMEFDVVVADPPPTAGYAALRLARRAHVPLVYYMSDSWVGASADMTGFAGQLRSVIRFLESRVVLGSHRVVAATRGMAEIARSFGPSQVTVIENGADLSAYSATGQEWTPGTGRPFFLYAGNAGAVHGAGVFTEAANLLWQEGLEFDLVFMGHGAEFESLIAGSPRPDRIHRVGTQPTHVVASAYRAAVGALSSLRPISKYADARPIKTLTGLATGCPAVYAGAGDFADELSRNDLGFISAWSPEGAASSMRAALALAGEPTAMANMRARCSRYAADHFDDTIPASKVVQVINEATREAHS